MLLALRGAADVGLEVTLELGPPCGFRWGRLRLGFHPPGERRKRDGDQAHQEGEAAEDDRPPGTAPDQRAEEHRAGQRQTAPPCLVEPRPALVENGCEE